MTKIDVRSFESADFSVFAEAYDKTWGYEISDDPADRVRELSGPFYLAGNLLKSDWVRVATVDGKPAGLLCASFDAEASDPALTALALAHHVIIQAADEELAKTEKGRSLLDFLETLHENNESNLALMRKFGLPPESPELVYFITHPDYRRRGVGKALLMAFDAQCIRRGVRAAYLFTDTHCAWQAYLRYGWQKMVESPKNRFGLKQLALRKSYSPF